MREMCSQCAAIRRRWPFGIGRQIRNPEATVAVVAEMIREASTGHAKYWALRLRSDRTFVGLCDLSELRPGDSADIGFMLVRRHWDQGLAQEAVMAVLEYAREIGSQIGLRARARSERTVRAAVEASRVRGGPDDSALRNQAWRVSQLSQFPKDIVTLVRCCRKNLLSDFIGTMVRPGGKKGQRPTATLAFLAFPAMWFV